MMMPSFLWRITFPLLIFISIDATWYTVLRVYSGSRVSVFSLWNYTGAHCNRPGILYRNKYIDNITLECILDIHLLFASSDTDKFRIILRAFSNFHLGNILHAPPYYVDDWVTGADRSPANEDNYLISTDNYEYLWLNSNETKMYAGLYYNEADSYFPKFVFSFNGVDYTPGMTSSQLVGDRDVQYVEVKVNMKLQCEHPLSEPVDESFCLGPDVSITGVDGEAMEVDTGTQAHLTCTISTLLLVLDVKWTRDGNVLQVEQNPTKYQGVVKGTHTLLINNFNSCDSGVYECSATTAMGNETSQPINLQIAKPVPSNDQLTTAMFEEHTNCHSLQLLNTFTILSVPECVVLCLGQKECVGFKVTQNKEECQLFAGVVRNTTTTKVFIRTN